MRLLVVRLGLSTSNFARNSPSTSSNIEFIALELQRFWGVSKNDRDKLRARFGWRWCRRLPRVSQSGPVGELAWLSETLVAFARLCLCGFETAVAFAGEKWAFLVQFSGAKVMAVSVVPCWGRAVVMVVSCLPASVAAEVSLVAKSPRAGSYARKSSPCSITTPQIRRFCACWASFFAEMPLEGPRWANFVAPIGPAPVLDIARRASGWLRWGFAPCEAP